MDFYTDPNIVPAGVKDAFDSQLHRSGPVYESVDMSPPPTPEVARPSQADSLRLGLHDAGLSPSAAGWVTR